jgi:tetratricopeptide (TPR) repeat protein
MLDQPGKDRILASGKATTPDKPSGSKDGGDNGLASANAEQVKPKVPANGAKEEVASANLDPKVIWDEALAKSQPQSAFLIAAASFLAEYGKFDHSAELLKAAIRQGVMARPWMFEAIGCALEICHGDPEEIERAYLSAADLRPNDADGYLLAAKVMAAHRKHARAMEFCRHSAALLPGLPQAYLQALDIALQAKDVKGMAWAVENLLSRDWPVNQSDIVDRARKAVADLAAKLAVEGRAHEAEELVKTSEKPSERDLVIRLQWQGEADLDLVVSEPSGTECSFRSRLTPAGGVLQGDLAAEPRTEVYSAAKAFPGEFRVTVRRVWGRPVANKATLEIIRHQGTDAEEVQRETILLDGESPITVKLDCGRRTSLEEVPPLDSVRQAFQTTPAEDRAQVEQQLRKLALPITVGIEDGRFRAGMAQRAARSTPSTSLLERMGQNAEDVVRHGTVKPYLNSGLSFTAQASRSADGNGLLLKFKPVFSHLEERLPTLPVVPGGQ